jgi:hypothetical protein
MPYPLEKASRLGHVPTATNAAVRDALQRWSITSDKPDNGDAIVALCAGVAELEPQGALADIDFSITVDGSDTEVEVTREHPTVKVGYLRVAGSMVKLDEFRHLGQQRYIDPRLVRRAHAEYAFDAALPGSQLARPGLTGTDTWRAELDAFLGSARFDSSTAMTLAEGLLALCGTNGVPATTVELRVCPACNEKPGAGQAPLTVGLAGGSCPYCGNSLYLADVLRTHEEYNVEGSNFTPIGRVMTAAERLMTLCYMQYFTEQAPDVLRHTIFITDGPLALFGPQAPLSRRFQAYHSQLATRAAARGVVAPVMVGVEKSGTFVEHAELIKEFIPLRNVMRLTNDYVNRVTGRPATNRYGEDEFYGRRFIYRTSAGDPLVITVPPRAGLAPYQDTSDAEQFASYPTLRLVCEVLDSLRTRMYKNAVMPVALAHSSASLPLGVGRSVLTMMAQQNIPGLKLDIQAVRAPSYYNH